MVEKEVKDGKEEQEPKEEQGPPDYKLEEQPIEFLVQRSQGLYQGYVLDRVEKKVSKQTAPDGRKLPSAPPELYVARAIYESSAALIIGFVNVTRALHMIYEKMTLKRDQPLIKPVR